MSLSLYNIRKWCKMFAGKSVYHTRQGVGKCFTDKAVRGYYNDLTTRVLMSPQLLDNDLLPKFKAENGIETYFPVEIVQFGLGAYDLFLLTGEDRYLDKFKQCVHWLKLQQEESGAWDNFSFIYPDHPYSAMVQGECASLFVRAYMQTSDEAYLATARKALLFMLKPLEEGGTARYIEKGLVLHEYTHWPAVLNGWVFAWWGLWDYVMITGDEDFRTAMEQSAEALLCMLPDFSRHHWSMYALNGRIASPHYHYIHIAQMTVMHQLTGRDEFVQYERLWRKWQNNLWYKSWAFVLKTYQKLTECND